jgi:hypothetical protein
MFGVLFLAETLQRFFAQQLKPNVKILVGNQNIVLRLLAHDFLPLARMLSHTQRRGGGVIG